MASLSVGAPKGTAKRDALRANEIQVQAMWEREKAFEANANDGTSRVVFGYLSRIRTAMAICTLDTPFLLQRQSFVLSMNAIKERMSCFPLLFIVRACLFKR